MKRRSSFWAAFGYAGQGVWHTLRHQRNLRVHVSVALAATLMGWIFQITVFMWGLLVLAIASVLSLELVNTALEAVVDLASPGYHPIAKIAKDAAAGAVLVAAGAALVLGLLLYLPQLGHFGEDFMIRWRESPVLMIIICTAIVLASVLLWGWVPDRQEYEGGQNRFGETH